MKDLSNLRSLDSGLFVRKTNISKPQNVIASIERNPCSEEIVTRWISIMRPVVHCCLCW